MDCKLSKCNVQSIDYIPYSTVTSTFQWIYFFPLTHLYHPMTHTTHFLDPWHFDSILVIPCPGCDCMKWMESCVWWLGLWHEQVSRTGGIPFLHESLDWHICLAQLIFTKHSLNNQYLAKQTNKYNFTSIDVLCILILQTY